MVNQMTALGKALGANTQGITGMVGKLGILTATLGTATAAFSRVNDFAQKNVQINERLLLMGSDQINMFKANEEAMKQNTASIADQMAVATEMREMGLDTFRKQQVALASNMKMTGQNTTAALQLFEGLEKNTTMTVFAQEKLAKDIQKTADSYGRTADSIVKALSKLNTTYLERTGQDVSKFQSLMMEVAGKFGPDAADLLGQTLQSLEISSPEDIAKLSAMGVGQEVKALMADPNLNNAKALTEAMSGFQSAVMSQSAEMRNFFISTVGDTKVYDNLRLLGDQFAGPAKTATDQDLISQTLAADRAKAKRDVELKMATVTGFRHLTQLGIEANKFLDMMSFATVGKVIDLLTGNKETAKMGYQAVTAEMEEQNRLAREQSDLNKQKRLEEQSAAVTNVGDLARFAVEGNLSLVEALSESIKVQREMSERLESLDKSSRKQATENAFAGVDK